MVIHHGLEKNFESNVADLFLDALGGKFLPILGNRNKAKQLLELSLNNENCFCAISDSKLQGILAFQTNESGFLSMSFKKIVSVYGPFPSIVKALGLSILDHKTSTNDVYIEAIAVDESAHGQGIGTKLLEKCFDYAKEKKYETISLQVIDLNAKAKTLYERLGFKVVKHITTFPLNRIIGWSFNEVFLMKKDMS